MLSLHEVADRQADVIHAVSGPENPDPRTFLLGMAVRKIAIVINGMPAKPTNTFLILHRGHLRNIWRDLMLWTDSLNPAINCAPPIFIFCIKWLNLAITLHLLRGTFILSPALFS